MDADSRWYVGIRGEYSYLEEYRGLCGTSDYVQLSDWRQDAAWLSGRAISAPAPTGRPDLSLVLQQGREALEILHGVHSLLYGGPANIEVTGSARHGVSGRLWFQKSIELQWSVFAEMAGYLPGLTDSTTLLQAIEADEEFRWAVRHLARRDLDYIDFRKIFEIVRAYYGGRTGLETSLPHLCKAIDHFWTTIHFRKLSGRRALHATQSNGPAGFAVQMGDQDIRNLLTQLLHAMARHIVETGPGRTAGL